MRAVVCARYGGPEVLQLQQRPKPIPKNNEVLIKVYSGVVTAAGLIGRKGTPYFTRLISGLTKPKNDILGMEFAGEIEEIGNEVSSFKPGDEVFGLTGIKLGANAEYLCLPQESALIKKPTNLNFDEAVAIIEGGLTAINFLMHKGRVMPSQQVLINGASGSVGTASIQLAKHLGAEVTGVCSTVNLQMAQSLGADEVIDYTLEDFARNGKTYDLIFDTVGKRSFPDCKNSMKPGGVFLNAAGLSTVFYMLWTKLFGSKKAILAATYMRSSALIKEDLILLKQLLEEGAIQPQIDRRYPLEEIARAHSYVETGRKKGNVVVQIVR